MPNYWPFLWKVWFGYVDFGVSLLWRLLLGAPESFLKTFYRIWYLRCCLFRWYIIVILFYTISPLILHSKTYATIKMLSLIIIEANKVDFRWLNKQWNKLLIRVKRNQMPGAKCLQHLPGFAGKLSLLYECDEKICLWEELYETTHNRDTLWLWLCMTVQRGQLESREVYQVPAYLQFLLKI
jgi:hypothetical protein